MIETPESHKKLERRTRSKWEKKTRDRARMWWENSRRFLDYSPGIKTTSNTIKINTINRHRIEQFTKLDDTQRLINFYLISMWVWVYWWSWSLVAYCEFALWIQAQKNIFFGNRNQPRNSYGKGISYLSIGYVLRTNPWINCSIQKESEYFHMKIRVALVWCRFEFWVDHFLFLIFFLYCD